MTFLAHALSTGVEARVLRDARTWDALEHRWDELWAMSPTRSPTTRFDWLRTWWELYGGSYGHGASPLAIVTFWRSADLVGALPLYLHVPDDRPFSVPSLMLLATGEAQAEETCSEYLDLLHLPGEAGACVGALADLLSGSNELAWGELHLHALSQTSPLSGLGPLLGAASKPLGFRYVCDLSGGFDRYLASLSPRTRAECRSLLKSAHKNGLVLELAADARAASEYFVAMVELHQRRWISAGKPGCFSSARFTDFHRRIASRWVCEDEAVLARVRKGDETLAVIYGVKADKKVDSYLQGLAVGTAAGVKSLGTVSHLLLKERLAERGIEAYDYLLGAPGDYKERFANATSPVVRLSLSNWGLRTAAAKCGQLLSGAVSRGMRALGEPGRLTQAVRH